MKAYLKRDWNDLSVESAKKCGKMYGYYDVSEEGLLVYCLNSRLEGEYSNVTVRLVIPESFETDFCHHYHTCFDGGHQGIGRTYQRIRRYCH